jgi:hypothetical protein
MMDCRTVNYLSIIILVLFSAQLQSCGDDDPISAVACNWNDPFFCAREGDLTLINSSTSRSIVRLYMTKDCTGGWGNTLGITIAPHGSITFDDLDSDDKYNVKADWSDDTCDTKFGIEIPHGGEKEQTLARNPAGCNINQISC